MDTCDVEGALVLYTRLLAEIDEAVGSHDAKGTDIGI
jgi:hypothetical protein